MQNNANIKSSVSETDLSEVFDEFFKIQSNTLKKKFTSKRINFYSCLTLDEARITISDLVGSFKNSGSITKIGFGDSISLHQLGVFEIVESISDIDVINPFERLPDGKFSVFYDQPEGRLDMPKDKYFERMNEVLEKMRETLLADIFITGTNAITMNGQIVSMDGTGNRLAGMLFGPKKVIIIAGRNKICRDTDDALKRIKDISAPLNYIRHNQKHHNRFDTPCLKLGYCVENCNHRTKGCLKTVIIDGSTPIHSDRVHLILVNADLGL
jgi:hypothetical protein